MIQLRDNIFATEVPSMAFGFDVNNYGDESEYMYMLAVEDIIDEPHSDETLIAKKLPPGTWEIVCVSKDAIEGRILPGSEEMVYHIGDLLASKGCDLKLNWLILKKQ
jgi:hypothetical protein